MMLILSSVFVHSLRGVGDIRIGLETPGITVDSLALSRDGNQIYAGLSTGKLVVISEKASRPGSPSN